MDIVKLREHMVRKLGALLVPPEQAILFKEAMDNFSKLLESSGFPSYVLDITCNLSEECKVGGM